MESTLVEMRPIKVAVRLFDAREHWHLSRAIEAGARMAGFPLQVDVPAGEADILVVAPEEPGAEVLLRGRAGQLYPLPVAYGLGCDATHVLDRPARARDVKELLERIVPGIMSAKPLHGAAEVEAEGLRVYSLPFGVRNLQAVLENIIESHHNGNPLEVSCASGGSLILIPRLRRVFGAKHKSAHEVAACISEAGEPTIRILSHDEARERCEGSGLNAVSLESVAWELSMMAVPTPVNYSNIHGLLVRLRRWPNFSLLPHRQVHLQLAALLVRKQMPVAELLQRMPNEFDTLARFLNACCAIGVLEVSPVADSIKVPESSGEIESGEIESGGEVKAGIFRKLIARLARR
ncbi:MAG TPA: hypothetical protein DF427_01245 [Moraxellaceae bacterium]|nr:hypothetical protein [Moraxellaceae bacterium]